jgi:hypothetical protein
MNPGVSIRPDATDFSTRNKLIFREEKQMLLDESFLAQIYNKLAPNRQVHFMRVRALTT